MKYEMKRFPRPEEIFTPPDADGSEANIKAMTFPIYWREVGVYFCVVWDWESSVPKVMILNHSLFPELRECIRRDLDDVVGQTFVVTCVHEGRIVRHRLLPTGMAPLLSKERLDEVKEFASGLYEAVGDGG